VGQAAVGLGHTAVTVSKVGVIGIEVALSGPVAGSRAAQRGAVLIPIPTREKVGPGQHVRANEHMYAEARAYQERVAGAKPYEAYELNDVRFDGFENGVLIDAKYGYKGHIKDGKFADWFRNGKPFIIQAERQIKAAPNMKIQWRFSEKEVADMVRELLHKNELFIDIVHFP